MCNGYEFRVWNGSTASFFSLPEGPSFAFDNAGGALAGVTGVYRFGWGYLNERGFFGPCGDLRYVTFIQQAIYMSGFTYPTGYGITAGVLYISSNNGSDIQYARVFPTGTATLLLQLDEGFPPFDGFSLAMLEPTAVNFTMAPRYIELFQNSLFLVGFSGNGSLIAYSETGEPENIKPDYNFEFRTDDGDFLTGAKQYQNALYLFKRYSFCKVIGTDPSNFERLDVFNEYGAVSNNAILVVDDVMLFLNEKGIAQYTGARPSIISDKIEDVFLNMNVDQALENATAVHDRDRNQARFSFPSIGSTINNTNIIYDYSLDAFSVEKGVTYSAIAIAKQDRSRKSVFLGTYDGRVGYQS